MNNLIKLTIIGSLTMVLSLSLAAGEDDATPPEANSPDAEMLAENPIAETSDVAKKMSDIMYEPLNGGSVELFTSGLEKVDKKATEKEYRDLMSSLDFLLFYDIGARRDKARLYSRLDGKSPAQVLERVAGIRNDK